MLSSQANLPIHSIGNENSSNQGDTQNYEASRTKLPIQHRSAASLPTIIKNYDWGYFGYKEMGKPLSTEISHRPTNDQIKCETDRFTLYLRGPTWLINKAWELEGRRARFGWDFNFITYNIISHSSAVFKYAKEGRVADLPRPFQN